MQIRGKVLSTAVPFGTRSASLRSPINRKNLNAETCQSFAKAAAPARYRFLAAIRGQSKEINCLPSPRKLVAKRIKPANVPWEAIVGRLLRKSVGYAGRNGEGRKFNRGQGNGTGSRAARRSGKNSRYTPFISAVRSRVVV